MAPTTYDALVIGGGPGGSSAATFLARAGFDQLLLEHAQSSGAEVRQGWTVIRFTAAPDAVTVEARDPAGRTARLCASFLIDASGRGNLTGNQEGLRVIHPRLKKLAV